MSVARHTISYDRAIEHTHRRKKCRCAITLIIMCLASGNTGTQRQQRLCAIKCLYLTFFINAKDNRLVRGIYVQADNITEFLDKSFITAELKCLDKMRFEVVSLPDAANGGFTD